MEEVRQLHARFCKGIKIWHQAGFLCSLLGREPQEREADCQLWLCMLPAGLEGWLALPLSELPNFTFLKDGYGCWRLNKDQVRVLLSKKSPGLLMPGILQTAPSLAPLCSVSQI
jgi:hypothetical protein